MTKVLVLYYSSYGHIERMADAIAEGAREAGASVDIKRVPEIVPPKSPKRAASNSTRPHPSPQSTNWPTTTRSSSARPPASATWPHR